ncbi:MAG: quinolinate phosphoribosyl transferase [Gammaproteobacteria bacterium]|nr:quinolinate phosphoribosyl transferase [Gammaproteobacteria bacterium]MDE0258268.1 quinolinate phosphoribosyl transferase [Gammaproteobacteria bacterium]
MSRKGPVPADSPAPPAPRRRAERLAPEVFGLPAAAMRAGHYTDQYFNWARRVLEAEARAPSVTMQVFQKKDVLLAGTDEAVAILRLCLAEGYRWEDLEVWSLGDGDRAAPGETVMLIRGPYPAFAHLETLYLGALARGTRVATGTRRAVEAAWPAPVLYFAARHDHWAVQKADGWAAHVAGAAGVSTDAQGAWWGGMGEGTLPHSLIAAYSGDTVAATAALARRVPDSVRVVSLVDFDNDCVRTALKVARALGEKLYAVRLDTAENMVDRSLAREAEAGGARESELRGVNRWLVHKVREALDQGGFGHVRIVVSGGFDGARIRRFRTDGVPVDAFGVGSSLIRGQVNFTADVVKVGGKAVAKAGRRYRPNPSLERVA